MTLQKGRIICGRGGFYTVALADSFETVVCKPRGRMRRGELSPLPGDLVTLSVREDGGRLEEILTRRNVFVRPPMANLDALVLVASLAPPVSDAFWIDRILSSVGGAEGILVFNKTDLENADEAAKLYREIGYSVIIASAASGEGVDAIKAAIDGKVAAFSGHSGVGKSSLMNIIAPELRIPVGGLSERLGRGKHTTRHVELFRLGNGWLADTPGFSAFDIESEIISFPEFERYSCRFSDCGHINTLGCAVAEAVMRGEIAESRYESYKRIKSARI
ncbi:putative ribosome biogenesis GTPase RsgA [Clostridia bacterium]|nr:putative ribosome biogenesis GTPase RsgA [Clostridia bacterium]